MSSPPSQKSSAEPIDSRQEQMVKLLEMASDTPVDRTMVIYAAGYILGMATSTRHKFDDYDREILAKASCFLKKSVQGDC